MPLPERIEQRVTDSHGPVAQSVTGPATVNVYQGTGFTPQQRRNRQKMLEKVHKMWIQDVLENSLHGAALQALGLEDHPKAVPQRGDLVVQEVPEIYGLAGSHPWPPGTGIAEVFDGCEERLLILGAPGGGKTTLLLELARTLLARAGQDEALPMPFVFPLSTWASRRLPLAEWLVEQLDERYDVQKALGEPWVEGDALLPLLDGLDEVAPEHRQACVEAINAFQQSRRQALPSLVVCSRLAEYEALTNRLKLKGAVLLQPLAPQQIDAYLDSVGAQLAGVREAVAGDATLRELAAAPLMLSVISLAYQGRPAEALAGSAAPEARRMELFASYVERMFVRKRVDTRYGKDQTLRWLAWLAAGMVRQHQTDFYLERLQPEWLPTRSARWRYTLLDRLGFGLLGGLVYGLAVGLVFGLVFGLADGQAATGLAVGLAVGLVSGLFGGTWDLPFLAQRGTGQVIRDALLGVMLGWPAVALVFGLVFGLHYDYGRVFGLFYGVPIGGLLGCLVGAPDVQPRRIVVVETLGWSRRNAFRSACTGLLIGLFIGLLGGLFIGLLGGLVGGLAHGLVGGLAHGLVFGLVFGLVGGLAYGGYACLSHFALRFVLWRGGAMPWNYVRFLDYATERIFLRRVGGGYIFVHRLLQEYFAGLGIEAGAVAPPRPADQQRLRPSAP